jgi:hypothetical protein
MVICDGAWRDPYTAKFTLIGTFSSIGGESFPLVHPIVTVYVALTDGHGEMPLRLELVDANEERDPIFSEPSTMKFDDPRMIFEFIFQARNVTFPEEGEYRLRLFANDEFMIERRILVTGPLAGHN